MSYQSVIQTLVLKSLRLNALVEEASRIMYLWLWDLRFLRCFFYNELMLFYFVELVVYLLRNMLFYLRVSGLFVHHQLFVLWSFCCIDSATHKNSIKNKKILVEGIGQIIRMHGYTPGIGKVSMKIRTFKINKKVVIGISDVPLPPESWQLQMIFTVSLIIVNINTDR